MNAARCRISGAGDLENGWKRLSGFNRTRRLGAASAAVDAALCADS